MLRILVFFPYDLWPARGKISVRNLGYGPRTRIVRGIYYPVDPAYLFPSMYIKSNAVILDNRMRTFNLIFFVVIRNLSIGLIPAVVRIIQNIAFQTRELAAGRDTYKGNVSFPAGLDGTSLGDAVYGLMVSQRLLPDRAVTGDIAL